MMKLVAAAAVVAMGMTGIATVDEAKASTVMADATEYFDLIYEEEPGEESGDQSGPGDDDEGDNE